MVHIWTKQIDGKWYAVAYRGECYAATAVEDSREEALRRVEGVGAGKEHPVLDSEETDFLKDTIRMLAALEAGDEEGKRFRFSVEDLSAAARRIYEVAACIPIGYAVSYGNIAAVSGVPARVVGHAMATNPLYPIVPCHRVVGGDFKLVGYGGRQDREALLAKLSRLRAEARSLEPRELLVEGGSLSLYPVEEVIWRAEREIERDEHQLSLFE